ncbi:16158_t:CDS:1, partial [Racocetra persica]
EDSEASDIELDTEHVITDHNNKVYCKYHLCAEEGYGSAWVSKNT